jgi:hypothetical protein
VTDQNLLEVRADEIRPFDSIAEGTVVREVVHDEVEVLDPFHGGPVRCRRVTVHSTAARTVTVEVVEGIPIRELSNDGPTTEEFADFALVRVIRPAPIEVARD